MRSAVVRFAAIAVFLRRSAGRPLWARSGRFRSISTFEGSRSDEQPLSRPRGRITAQNRQVMAHDCAMHHLEPRFTHRVAPS
jgi:hypothetical protein